MSAETTSKININASVDQAGQLSVRIGQQSEILGSYQEIVLTQAQTESLSNRLVKLILRQF